MNIVVVGGGKMGLPLACIFAERGADVTVCDTNPDIVASINAGNDPHGEPEQAEYVRAGVEAKRLRATSDTATAAREAEAIIVLVSALLTPERDIDWSSLVAASEAISRGLRKGALVSYETTLPVGGCRGTLVPVLERSGFVAGKDFAVVFSPERVKSQRVFARLRDTPKVVGGIDAVSAKRGEKFYAHWLGAPVVNVGSLESAEFLKLAGMVYRDVNIALANELGRFAEAVGLDAWPLISAANTDGETQILLPGIGVGGHCTPVYPHFYANDAARRGIDVDLARAARAINEAQPERQLQRLSTVLGGLRGKRVHILGLGFRPQVREDAYSPAIPLRDLLREAGAEPSIEDPLYSPAELEKKNFIVRKAGSDQLDAVVLNTAHAAFAKPDFASWKRTGVRAVLDGRALWREDDVRSAGLTYICVGEADGVLQAASSAAHRNAATT